MGTLTNGAADTHWWQAMHDSSEVHSQFGQVDRPMASSVVGRLAMIGEVHSEDHWNPIRPDGEWGWGERRPLRVSLRRRTEDSNPGGLARQLNNCAAATRPKSVLNPIVLVTHPDRNICEDVKLQADHCWVCCGHAWSQKGSCHGSMSVSVLGEVSLCLAWWRRRLTEHVWMIPIRFCPDDHWMYC